MKVKTPPGTKADVALEAWLEAHYDAVMSWKEYLHHEGSGKRTPEESQEAQNLHIQERERLSSELQAKQVEAISRWISQGLTREQAIAHWEAMENEAYRRSRFLYAIQKD